MACLMIANLELTLHSRKDGACSANSQHSEFLLCGCDDYLGLCVMEKKVNFFNQMSGYVGSQAVRTLILFINEKTTKGNKAFQELWPQHPSLSSDTHEFP